MKNIFSKGEEGSKPFIFQKKDVRQLYAHEGFGKENRYNSGKFDALTRNLRTGALLNNTHHCAYCASKMSQKCYDNVHYGFCVTWVSCVNSSGQATRVMCGERLCMRSDGCGKHPRVQGYNEPLYKIANQQPVSWSDLDDSNPLGAGEAVQDHSREVEEDLMWEVIEEIAAKEGVYADEIAMQYWEGRRIEDEYKRRDEVKTTRRNVKEQKGNKEQFAVNKISEKEKRRDSKRGTFQGTDIRTAEKAMRPSRKNRPPKAAMEAPKSAVVAEKSQESPETVKERIRQTIARGKSRKATESS